MEYYITHDGKMFAVANEKELVTTLRMDLRLPMGSDKEYMQSMARWCRVQKEGAEIRTHNPKVFVHDLLEHKLLTKLES